MDNNNKKTLKNLALYLGIPIVLFLIIAYVFGGAETASEYKYSDILNYFETDQVSEYTLDLGTGQMIVVIDEDTSDDVAGVALSY